MTDHGEALFPTPRLEARTVCVKGRVEGSLEAAHGLGFERGGAVPAAYDAAVFVEGDPRTLRELAAAHAGAGITGIYGAGHEVALNAMRFAF